MSTVNVDIAKEIATMWESYKRLATIWPTLENPDGEINSSTLDVIMQNPQPDHALLSPFVLYLKFMLSSHIDGILYPPTEATFNAWYKKTSE
jgi:hypothetical protein